MLDSFETRLVDLLADGLADSGAADEATIMRPRDDLPVMAKENPGRIMVAVQILSASPGQHLGDDSRERLGRKNDYRLRTTLCFDGEVALDFHIAKTPGQSDLTGFRPKLLQTVDQVLVVLHAANVRNGDAFKTGADQGFELEGFRLAGIGPLPEDHADTHAVRVLYRYSGRFWPVETPATGESIRALPTRMAVLPIQIPEEVQAAAGGEDVHITVRASLHVLGDAPVLLTARIEGASPPGELIGIPAETPGMVSYMPTRAGVFTVVYKPPAGIDRDTDIRIALSLSHPGHKSVNLGRFGIKIARR